MKPSTYLHSTHLLVSIALAACAVTPQAPTPAPQATQTSALLPTAPRTASPASSPHPTLTATASPRPTSTYAAPSPVATALALSLASWSPDSRWLAYRSFTDEDASQNPYEGTSILPYGTFHFLDVPAGAGCEYPLDNPYGLRFNLWHDWLPDGRVMTLDLAGEVVVLSTPCDGDTAAPLVAQARPRCLVTNPDSGQSCSPDGLRLGFSDETRQPRLTTISNTVSGELEAVITWPPTQDGVGHIGGPLWIDNDRFILQYTTEGPLLVTLSSSVGIEHLAPAYFGIAGNHSQFATAAPSPNGVHLLLTEFASAFGNGQLLLYHPESELVETLPANYGQFLLDGRWLDLRDDDSDPAWLRLVDPPHSEPREYLANQPEHAASLSHNLARVAVSSQPGVNEPATVQIYSRATGALLQAYALGHLGPSMVGWSPDDRFLAFIGYPSVGDQVLFVIEAFR